MKSKFFLSALLLSVALATGCSTQSVSDASNNEVVSKVTTQVEQDVPEDDTSDTEVEAEAEPVAKEAPVLSPKEIYEAELDERVDTVLKGMSLDEKAYQMLIVTPEALTGYGMVTATGDASKQAYDSKPVGGLIYFDQNFVDPDQTKAMTKGIQKYAVKRTGLPLFLCVDEEGGKVLRIGDKSAFGVTKVGPMLNIQTADEAYDAGKTIGTYLSELGLNVDFAPDADVLTNPNNVVIGDRSFSRNADTATEFASAYSKGLHDNNVMSTYKHFPGHGGTSEDSHEGFAYVDKSLKELKKNELKPFADANASGVDMVMVGHISLPQITNDNTPATLSKKLVSEVLRKKLGYEGLIVTDALGMGAITNNYSSDEAVKKSVKAGADLLLMPTSIDGAVSAIKDAVNSGEIKEKRIDKSVRRIIRAKLIWQDKEDGSYID
jgi:beta-N-acetylhexosaminidase